MKGEKQEVARRPGKRRSEEIAHGSGNKGGRRGGGKLQVDGLNFKAVYPAEVRRLTT